jgi:hypothetical protein
VRFLATVEQVRPGTATLPVAVLALLATTSCSSSGAQPGGLPPLGSTPAVSASPIEAPSAARARTAEGADAFVRFFFARMNVAFSSSDPTIIESLRNAECLTCANYEKALAATRKAQTFMRGRSFAVKDVAAAPLHRFGTLVEVFGNIPSRERVDNAGRVLKSLPAEGRFHLTVAVKWIEGHWLVSGIKLGSS